MTFIHSGWNRPHFEINTSIPDQSKLWLWVWNVNFIYQEKFGRSLKLDSCDLLICCASCGEKRDKVTTDQSMVAPESCLAVICFYVRKLSGLYSVFVLCARSLEIIKQHREAQSSYWKLKASDVHCSPQNKFIKKIVQGDTNVRSCRHYWSALLVGGEKLSHWDTGGEGE